MMKAILITCIHLLVLMQASAQEAGMTAEPWGVIISDLKFEGLNRTKEYIVTRELVSKVGEPCLRENLEQEMENLHQLDIFAQIKITPELGPNGVIVNYEFVELVMFLPSVGIRFSDETGVSAGLGIKVPNLMGKDIFLSARFLPRRPCTGGRCPARLRLGLPRGRHHRWL